MSTTSATTTTSPAVSSPPASVAPRQYGVPCTPSRLRLGVGSPMSEATQQETLQLVLSNAGPTGCDLLGYPHLIVLGQRGTVLPFNYRDGGDQMLTAAPPATVGLAPGADAYFAVNKNECVEPVEDYTPDAATRLTATLPGDSQALTVAITAQDRHLDYCPAGDPGHTLDVTPVEPSTAATLSQHLTGH